MILKENQEIFIGRDKELSTLSSTFEKSKTGELSSISISAKSGFGKSKLISQFLKGYTDEQQHFIAFGQGRAKKASRPFEMLLNFFSNLKKQFIADEIFTKYVTKKLSIDDIGILCSIYSGFNEVFGSKSFSNEEIIEEFGVAKCINALSKFITIVSSKTNHLILILDDCQWADELTLNLLESLINTRNINKSNYIYLICSYRSDEISEQHIIKNLKFTKKIELSPLNKHEIHSLIKKLNKDLPDSASKFVLNASRGNPFFVTSAVRSLVESGVLERESNDNFEKIFNDSNDSYGFLKKRFEYITFATLAFLKWSAIAGKVFNPKLFKDAEPLRLEGILKEAKDKYFIEELEDGKYIFVHDKIREALLSLIDSNEQLYIHQSIANELIRSEENNIFDIAYHLDECGLHDEALSFALKAAEESRRCFALEVAENNYRIAEKALDLSDSNTKLTVLEGLGDVLMFRAKYSEAKEYYDKAKKYVKNDFGAARIERKLGELLFKMGQNIQAALALESALNHLGEGVPNNILTISFAILLNILKQTLHTIFPFYFINYHKKEASEKTRLITQIYNRLAIVYWFSNGIFKTLWSHLSALNTIERYQLSHELAHTYSSHGPAMSLLGLYKRSTKYCFKALDVLNTLDENKLTKGQCLHFNGVAHYCTSQYRQSINFCLEAVTTLEDVGDYWEMNIASSNVALSLYRLGSLNKAKEYSKKEYERTLKMGDLQSATVFLLVETLASKGEVNIELFDKLLKDNPTNSQSIIECMCGKARILIKQNKYREAFIILSDARIYLYKTASIQEYSFIAIPWLLTSIRLLFEKNLIKDKKERKKLLLLWKRVLLEAKIGMLIRKNNIPHILRENAEFYLYKGKIKKSEKLANKCLAICKEKGLILEQYLTLKTLIKIDKYKNKTTNLELHSLATAKRKECFKF